MSDDRPRTDNQRGSTLQESERRYRLLFENMTTGFAVLTMLYDEHGAPVDFRFLDVNPAFERLTGLPAASILGRSAHDVLPELDQHWLEIFARIVQTGTPEVFEGFLTSTGKWFEVRAFKTGEHQFATIFTDITERKQMEDKLRLAQLQWDQFLETSPDEMWIKDASGRYVAANKTFRMVDPSKDGNIIGKTDAECFSPERAAAYVADDQIAIEKGVSEGEFTAVGVDGKLRYFLTKKVVLRTPTGEVAGTLGVSRDITERKQMEQKLEEMATHDFLTGLPNRVLLIDRFNIAAALAHRNKAKLAIMSLDLDKFKSINDTFGHDVGDQVLKIIGRRLTRIMRASDTFARVGGDEFISVMMETSHLEDATAVAQKILDSFAEPISVGGHRLLLSTSIGIAVYPDDGEDLETLTQKSDAAMYYSKGHGGNRFTFYKDAPAG